MPYTGGSGIGQVFGPANRDEAIATAHEAIDAGISFLDLAPSYGKGEAEPATCIWGGSWP